jgi:hypothetical protein
MIKMNVEGMDVREILSELDRIASDRSHFTERFPALARFRSDMRLGMDMVVHVEVKEGNAVEIVRREPESGNIEVSVIPIKEINNAWSHCA